MKSKPHVFVEVDFPCCGQKLKLKIPIMKKRFKVICYRCWLVYDGFSKKGKYKRIGKAYPAGAIRIRRFDKSKKK